MIKGLEIVVDCRVYADNSVKNTLELFATVPYSSLPVAEQGGAYLGVIRLKDLVLLGSDSLEHPILPYVINCAALLATDNIFKKKWIGNCDIVPIVDSDNLLKGFLAREAMLNKMGERYSKLANQYLQVLNSSYNGVMAINTEGRIFVFNPVAERILGFKSTNVLGMQIASFTPNFGLLETMEKQEAQIGVKFEVNDYTLVANMTPLIYDDRCIGAMAVFIDVSQTEKVNRELFANKELAFELNAIFESSYDGLYICDKNGKVLRVNSAWEKVCGFPRDMVMGKTAMDLVANGYYDNSAALLTLQSKSVSTTMLKIMSGPKKGQIIMATGTPILDEEGQLVQVVVNVRDITELENLKKKLSETMQLSMKYANELEEIRLQTYRMDDLIAKSPVMQRIVDLVVKVAQVDSTILITGESGVGKEVIAKKIHQLSKRKDNSLIKINCGAIPENLLESELFGYEGGAFTGAKKEGKPGMFELASGGTLFLDEIGDLPFGLQVKLLRALQEREIVRVGGVKSIKVDARIITATNKDLHRMVSNGTFREDLFYRLNVINIQIPPLRERKEDLVQLLSTLLQSLNGKYRISKTLSQQVVTRLINYDWPGNIRELENTLERMVVLTQEEEIQLQHLPEYLANINPETNQITIDGIIPLKRAVQNLEYKLLLEAYRKYGTTRAMAKALEVNQSTIVRKMKQHGFEQNDDVEHQPVAYQHLFRI